jgi:hypothetical protein
LAILGRTTEKDTPGNNLPKENQMKKLIEETANATASPFVPGPFALGKSDKHGHGSLHAEE